MAKVEIGSKKWLRSPISQPRGLASWRYYAVAALLGSSTCGYEAAAPENQLHEQVSGQAAGQQNEAAQPAPGLRAAYIRAKQAQGAEQPAYHFGIGTGGDSLNARSREQSYAV